jgi:hypothetical protein
MSNKPNSDNFCARILLNSNIELHIYKRNTNFLSWLKTENITVDRNLLPDTMHPTQIGFITHMITRTDQTSMYEQRLHCLTRSDCPPFFLQIKYIKTANVTTKVWNVYANQNDTEVIITELNEALNTPGLRQFLSWFEYSSLQTKQQVTTINLNNTFNTEYRSLILPGFTKTSNDDHVMWCDNFPIEPTADAESFSAKWRFSANEEDTMMQDEDIQDRFHNGVNLTTTTVSEYIKQQFYSGDDTQIFAHIFDPINGNREALVPRKHIPEELQLIKYLNIELSKIMNQQAVHNVFENPEEILALTTTTQPWTPFDIQKSIPHTHYPTYLSRNPNDKPKRPRQSITYRSQQANYPDSIKTQLCTRATKKHPSHLAINYRNEYHYYRHQYHHIHEATARQQYHNQHTHSNPNRAKLTKNISYHPGRQSTNKPTNIEHRTTAK